MSAVPKFADKKSLKNLVPLNGLSSTHFEELAKKAAVLELKPGKYLFKKGERDSSTCYVLEGEIALVDGSDIKLTIQGGTEEAKHPIAQQQPRQLGARAKTHCTVVSIDSGLLDVMLAWEQSTAYEVDNIESDDEDWMTRMMQSDLMQRLPATNLQQLFMRMEEVEVKAGEVVFNQDEEGDYYYIIKQGKCIVSRKPSANGRAVKLAELKDGDSFGEESLLSGAKRNASITMLTVGKLMRLAKNDFNELLKSPLLSQVDYKEAKKLVSEGAIYLDVRLPGEFTNTHLKDSINIPLAAIRTDIVNIDREKEYIVYCDTGRRSTSAVFLLGQFGIEAHVLKDGLSNVPMEEHQSVLPKEAVNAEVIDINRDKEGSESVKEKKPGNAIDDKQRQILEKNIVSLQSEVKSLENKLLKTEKEITKNEKKVTKTNELVSEEQEKVKSLEDELLTLRDVEIEFDKLKEKLAKSEGQLDEHKKLLETTRQSDEYAQKKMLSQQKELDKVKSELEEARNTKTDYEMASNGKHKELEVVNRKLQSLSKERDELVNRLASQDEEKASFVEDLQVKNKQLEEEVAALNRAVAENEKNQREVQAASLRMQEQMAAVETDVKVREDEKEKLLSQLNEVQEKSSREQSEYSNALQQKQLLEDEIQELKASRESEIVSQQENIKALQDVIETQKSERESYEKELLAAQAQSEHLQENIRQAQQLSEASDNDISRQLALLQEQASAAENKNEELQSEIAVLQSTQVDNENKLNELSEVGLLAESIAANRIKELEVQLEDATKDSSEKETLLAAKVIEYQESESRVKNRIAELEQEVQNSKSHFESEQKDYVKQLDESKLAVEQLDRELEELGQRASDAEKQMQARLLASEEVQGSLQEEISGLQGKIEQGSEALAQQIASQEQEHKKQIDQVAALELTIENTESANRDLQKTVHDLESSLEGNNQAMDASAGEKQALELQLKESRDELDNIRNVLSNANLNKDDLESRYQQQYEQFKIDREGLEEQLLQSKTKVDELAALNKRLEESQHENKNILSQYESVNAELDSLRAELLKAGDGKEQLLSLQNAQVEEFQSEKTRLENELQLSQSKIDALTDKNEILLSENENKGDKGELDALKAALEEAKNKLSLNEEALAKKTREDENIKNEMISLRAVYVQKETDVTRLQEELSAIKAVMEDGSADDDAKSDAVRALEQELSLVRERSERAEIDNNEELTALKVSVDKKQKLIEEYVSQIDEVKSKKSDAESAVNVMESEIDELRGATESYKTNIAESHKKIEVLQFELEAIKGELADNSADEEKVGLISQIDASTGRVSELENALQISRDELNEANDKFKRQLEAMQAEQAQSSKDLNLKGQIDQLKLEMKTQMDMYKAEVNDNADKLTEENAKLQSELKALVIEKENTTAASHSVNVEADHSALFDLPDIDKNLFNVNNQQVKSSSSIVTSIILALIFSAVSAGAVYWYFVMNSKQGIDAGSAAVATSATNKASDLAGKGPGAAATDKNRVVASKTASLKKPASTKGDGQLKPSRIFSDFLSEGGKGPIMVGVPAGIFSMGSPSNSTYFDERPQHTVSLRKFSISKHEVSFADYDRFVEATGRALPSDSGWGRDNRPVVNVSWGDAVAYTEWLSEQTGHQYRLPSEAEWEYAARAGTQGKYWWGATLEHGRANCFNCGSQWDRTSSAPTGSFAASSLGLHDMSGNIMEWVSDCYHANYDGAPIDGSVWGGGSCKSRVVRDGSYRSTSEDIRVTKRSGFSQESIVDHIGFRIVRVR